MNLKLAGLGAIVIVLILAVSRWLRQRRRSRQHGETYPFF